MVLSAAQMARMSHLLEQALALDEAGRKRWLESLSVEQRDIEPALRRALLSQNQAGADALATLPKLAAATGKEKVGSGLQAATMIGPYRLVRQLGAGGMAEVWLAQRADGAYKRDVALKLPTAMDLRADISKRFARERDILAGLEHPNIARFYDAGLSKEGLPYLAMEYAHGEPITQWCDTHLVEVRDRVKLFLQVLDAVQYAHARKVLHRDIKPSNILVTGSGQVRLLDFGVAKLLADEETRTQLTQLYGQAFTPEYASPELLRGDRVQEASDIYALGVVLYELLSGTRPYRLKATAPLGALERSAAQTQIPRPSLQISAEAAMARATTASKLARQLRGDLDAIALKALQRDLRDRYSGAENLADELHRYLTGAPIQARLAHPLYLLSRFVLRHRSGIATAAIVVLIVAVALGLALTRGS